MGARETLTAILNASIPALIVAGGIVVFVDATTFSGMFLSINTMLWIVSDGFTISGSPFLMFIAYVLRLATLAVGSLTLSEMAQVDADFSRIPNSESVPVSVTSRQRLAGVSGNTSELSG